MQNRRVLHIVLIILGTIYIFSTVFHSNIWFDEAYSVAMANHSFIDIWNIGKNDVHPVLYYWLLRIVKLITGGSILAYRLFSSIPIVLMGILGITHIKKDFGEKTGILFSFFSCFLPVMTVYANQIRMYSWSMYTVTILVIYSYRIYLGKSNLKNWIIFLITSLVSIYIHYYGLLAVGIINVFLLINFIIKKKWKELKILIVIGIIQLSIYMPWIMVLFSQMKHISRRFWIGFTFPKTIYEIVGCQMNGALNEISDLLVGFIANILLVIYLIVVVRKNRRNKNLDLKPIIYWGAIYVGVILLALLITFVTGTIILHSRYLFVITGVYIFLVSYILAKANNKYLIRVVCLCVFVLSVNNNIIQRRYNYAVENDKPLEYLNENVQEYDVFVFNEAASGFVCATIFMENKHYFYNKENWGVEEAYKVWAPQLKVCLTTDFLENCVGRIWVIGTWNNSCYEELFNNERYKVIDKQYFSTKYQNYLYNITLVEKL